MDKYVPLMGGLDLQTPPISVEAGKLREAVNVYESVNGGYTTLKGYERFDGGVSPSASRWYRCRFNRTSGTGPNSADFPIFVAQDDSTETVFMRSGPALRGEVISFIENPLDADELSMILLNPRMDSLDTYDIVPELTLPELGIETTGNGFNGANEYSLVSIVESGEPDDAWDTMSVDQADSACRAMRRADSRDPRGDGAILGVHQILGQTLAWREDLANDTNVLSVVGKDFGEKDWQSTKLAKIVLVATDTATGDARDVLGTPEAELTGAGSGYTIQDVRDPAVYPENLDYLVLIYTGRPNSNPADIPDGAIIESAGFVYGATTLGSFVGFTINSGGTMESINHNFYAGVDTNRAYFADGVNPVMYYDPLTEAVVPIMTTYSDGLFTNQSVVGHLAAFQSRLIASTSGGGFITSVAGNPIEVNGILGSIEIGVGEFVTGFHNASANELMVFTTGSTWSLSGDDPETNWTLRQVTGDSGAKPSCIVDMGEVYAADDVGIVNVKRSDVLGGFTSSTVSNNIQRLYNGYDKSQSCSTVVKGLEQMRFFFGSEGLIGTRVAYQSKNGNDAVRYGFTRLSYPIPVITVNTDRLPSGEERTLFGSNTGLVYIMDSGTHFDGLPITSTLSTVYNHISAPWQKKRFEAITVETVSADPSIITIDHNLNDGAKDYDSRQIGVAGSNTNLYAVSTGASDVAKSKVRLRGTGYNVQFTLTRTSADNAQVAITGYTLRYTPRGLVTI